MTKPTRADREILANTIADECIVVRLRMLNRVVTNIYDKVLRPLGLKISQLNILVATAKIGTARPAEIGDRLKLDTSTLSRNVERMKAKGWLEVVPDEDGRAQPFRVTPKGFRLLERAKPKWEQAQIETRKLLGQPFVSEVGDAVTKMRKSSRL